MQINGVSYNVAAFKGKTKAEFILIAGKNFGKLPKEKRDAAIDEVWQIINDKNGNTNRDGATHTTVESKGRAVSRRSRKADEGILPESERNADGDGVAE